MLPRSVSVDELAGRDTALQRLDPRAKLLVTFAFLIVLSSYDRHAWSALFPLLLYPAVLIGYGLIPLGWLCRRLTAMLPFVAVTALALLMRDAGRWQTIALLLTKSCLAVSAALILSATTGSAGICRGLRRLGLPSVITTQLLLTLRYLTIITDEAGRLQLARQLRSCGRRGLGLVSTSQLISLLFIRSMQRAERLYHAMVARGFQGDLPAAAPHGFGLREWRFCLLWIAFFSLARLFDLPAWAGVVLTGGVW